MPTRRSAILVARCFTYLALVALSAAGGWAARWRQEAKEPKAAEPEGALLGVEPFALVAQQDEDGFAIRELRVRRGSFRRGRHGLQHLTRLVVRRHAS